MSKLPNHPAGSRLALLAMCGDLVIAIEADVIFQIRRAEETKARMVDRAMSVIELDGQEIVGWDLGELLGLGASADAWVIVTLPDSSRIGLRIGRCLTVQPLPVCRAVPRTIFVSRAGAITAGFSASGIAELEGYPSGVVIDTGRLLTESELVLARKLTGEGREATPPS